jgi:uncharacterized protein (UPF0276 family)
VVSVSQPRLGFPDLGIGVGLRTAHYREILDHWPAMPWFEVLTDNYLQTQGRPLLVLDSIAARYPVALHGVGLSIGSTDPLDEGYVREVAALRDRVGARWVSDHLCWTGVQGRNSHDLLPMPLTDAALDHVAERVLRVQELLGQPLVLENPSTYVGFRADTWHEADFLAALCARTGCGLLVDVNNVWVSSRNHGWSALDYLDRIPADRVVQVHVAGHTDLGTHCVDTHIGPVVEPVWGLLQEAWRRGVRASVLLEWDAEIPPFAEVAAEARRAGVWLEAS